MVYHIIGLLAGKLKALPIWNVHLLVNTIFTEDINVPVDKVLPMHSPRIDGCLTIDGEVFIE